MLRIGPGGRATRQVLLVMGLTLVGCGTPADPPVEVPVALYGRNAAAGVAWFAVHPVTAGGGVPPWWPDDPGC